MHGTRLVLAAALVSFLSTTLLAQEPAPTPVFESSVSLVLLPVFVIDKDGRAVRGLGPGDFEVREDGRKVDVVSFSYVDTTGVEEQNELPLASAARRRFLLLFDKSFTDLGGLERARRAAADFVRRQLAPSDLAAVASFDVHNGVRVVANFTEDRALLVHAVQTLGIPSITRISDPLGLAADLMVTDVQQLSRLEEVADAELSGLLRVLARQMRAAEEESYRRDILVLVESFQELARALRSVEGRKQILYFSAGFDGRMLVGLSGSEQKEASDAVVQGRLWEVDGLTRHGDSRLRGELSEALRSLSSADAVVHSIDVTGLGTDRSLTQTLTTQDGGRDTTNRESLNLFASETGGRLFKNANDVGPALAEMLEMTSRYYVLGFQPEREKGPGVFHKIKVKAARKNVKLSHRAGYFEREPAGRQTALQRRFDLAELVVTGEGRNQVPFSSLCLPFPEKGERQTLGLVVQVPRDSLRWQGDKPVSLEVYGYAVAEDGTVRDHVAQSVRIDPARADPEGRVRGVSFFGTFSVPPGRYTIRLLVREGESGRTGVRFLDVTVPPHDGRTAFALPPLLLDDAGGWLNLEISPGKAAPTSTVRPFRIGAEPLVPRASFEVRPGAPERLALVVWSPEMVGDPAADVEVRSSLSTRDGRSVPSGRLRIERVHRDAGGRRTFVFSYTPEALEAGDYTLRIGLGEGGTLAESYALLRVRPSS